MKDQSLNRLAEDGMIAERATYYAVLYARIREAARQQGYALALHGSLTRDMDVIAVPWTQEACSETDLVRAIVQATGGMIAPKEKVRTEKLHGRVAWTIFLGGTGGYIDLSVMPRHEGGEGELLQVNKTADAWQWMSAQLKAKKANVFWPLMLADSIPEMSEYVAVDCLSNLTKLGFLRRDVRVICDSDHVIWQGEGSPPESALHVCPSCPDPDNPSDIHVTTRFFPTENWLAQIQNESV